MAVIQRHWYNDREVFLRGFVRSDYITAFTDWFMGLAGKATELVLYGTVLYSCAQLYPGVHLPTNVSLAVFLIQMGALDIGGLSLGKLAKQAREDGNVKGADQAATLSKWLIGIMLAGVVTVGIEHVIPLSDQIQTGVQLVLVVGRSFCAVLYGRVVHDLKTDLIFHRVSAPDVTAKLEVLQTSLEGQIRGLSREIREGKPTANVTVFPPQYEQVKWSESAVVWEQSNFVFMEYGQQKMEEDSLKSEEQSSENLAEDEQEEAASQGVSRSKYTMTFEEASSHTGYSISTLKAQLSDGKIKQSLSGKLLVKSLKMKPGYSGNVLPFQLIK